MRCASQRHSAERVSTLPSACTASPIAPRNPSSSCWPRPRPTIAKSSGSSPVRRRFTSDGISSRLVRSPVTPKMTSTQGGAACVPSGRADAASDDVRRADLSVTVSGGVVMLVGSPFDVSASYGSPSAQCIPSPSVG